MTNDAIRARDLAALDIQSGEAVISFLHEKGRFGRLRTADGAEMFFGAAGSPGLRFVDLRVGMIVRFRAARDQHGRAEARDVSIKVQA